MGGTRYTTKTSSVKGRQSSYGYTNQNQVMKNYGGRMPQKSSYGYTGKAAAKKNDKVKLAMAAAAGVAVGVGGYYAYNRYRDMKRARSQTWCSYQGEFMDCETCRRRYGSFRCKEETRCFSQEAGSGCGYQLTEDVNRDDLMATGFLPKAFTPPLLVAIKKIEGTGLKQTDLKCDPTSLELASKGYQSTVDISFKPLLFLTLTSMDSLDDPSAEDPTLQTTDHTRPGCIPSVPVLALAALLFASTLRSRRLAGLLQM